MKNKILSAGQVVELFEKEMATKSMIDMEIEAILEI
jgi:hypothetical protein